MQKYVHLKNDTILKYYLYILVHNSNIRMRNEMMERISITLEKEVLTNFDNMRGMVKRSTYINQLMSAEIAKVTGGKNE